MNQLKFYGRLLCAATGFFLLSCNNSGNNSTTETTTGDTTSATYTTAEKPLNAIVTTPETMMLVRNKVTDYDKWLAGFESHDSLKLANGLHNYVIGRSVADPNMLLVATKADDIAKAKAFGQSPELKQAMQKDGVVGKPTIAFVTTVYQDTSTIATPLRSMTMITVKDWDTWKAGFESHRQDRLDAGLTDRVYGHDPTDNHKVTIVVAVSDTAKANAFWNSDKLKDDMAKGGVVGKPERFMFRMAKKY